MKLFLLLDPGQDGVRVQPTQWVEAVMQCGIDRAGVILLSYKQLVELEH